SGGREFDQEPGSVRIVFLSADAAAVLENYLLNDRETQSGTTVAARKVWLKQPSKITRLDSLARVRDFGVDDASFGIVARRNRDSSFSRGVQSLDCVVDQV